MSIRSFGLRTALFSLSFAIAVATGARAHVGGDVTSVTSDQAGHLPFTVAGEAIDFKLSLAGTFVLTNVNGGTLEALPELRMVVNGTNGAATLVCLSPRTLSGGHLRTDALFRYVVRPGDMAQPLTILMTPTTPWQFEWRGWEVRDSVTGDPAVWRFNVALSLPFLGEVYDANLAKAKLEIRTLAFDESDCEAAVSKKELWTDWRVSTLTPAGPEPVDFYVWTSAPHLLQIGGAAGQSCARVSLPAGATSVEFPIKGLAVGSADVYLQRPQDYANNASLGVTNYVKRSLAITAPSTPWVRLTFSESGTGVALMQETHAPAAGSFKVELSEAFSNEVTVQVNPLPDEQSSLVLAASPLLLRIPAGQEESPEQSFSVPDGTMISEVYGVTLSPAVSGEAAAHFTDRRCATVFVQNVSPSLTASGPSRVLCGAPCTLDWSAFDVPADLASLTLAWNLNGETIKTVTGGAGSLQHTFSTAGLKTVRVVATDKEGASSSEAVFLVSVEQATVFADWAAQKGLSGDAGVLFGLDHDGDGVANGFEYVFGDALADGTPLMAVRSIGGRSVLETPARDLLTTLDARLLVEACTNLSAGQWAVPVAPFAHADKPADRDWYAPLDPAPEALFFRLRALLE